MRNCRVGAHALALLLFVSSATVSAHADVWTDRTGKHHIDASFVRITHDAVVLRKDDGSEITVPFEKLDERSRRLAHDRAAESKQTTKASSNSSAVSRLAEINDAASEGIRAEDNAVIAFWSAIGPNAIDADIRREYLDVLGGNITNPITSFVTWPEFVKSEGGRDLGHATSPLLATDVEAVDKWLARNEQPLEAAVGAMQRPAYYSPMVLKSKDDPLWQALVPITLPARDVTYGVLARVRLSRRLGNIDVAASDAVATFRWARLVSGEKTLFGLALSRALERVVINSISEVADDERFNRRLAEHILKQIAASPPHGNFVDKLQHEKLVAMDIVARIADGGPQELMKFIVAWNALHAPKAVAWADTLGGRAGIEAAAKRWNDSDRAVWNRAISEIGAKYDAYEREFRTATLARRIAIAERIPHELENTDANDFDRTFDPDETSPEAIELKRRLLQGILPPDSSESQIAQRMHSITCPDLAAMARLDADAAIRNALIPVVIALGLYHAEQGDYPMSLDKLVPEFLDEMPKDPLFDEPLIYDWQSDGYRLYSAGPNGFDNDGDFKNSVDNDDLGIVVVPPQ